MKDWQRVEAVLFGSGKYLTEDQIAELSGIKNKKSLKNALVELKNHYAKIDSSLDVFKENESWKLNVKEDFAHIVKNVISEAEMPRPVMETLAIIAYKSPVLQSEVIDTRGSGAYDHVALLEEKGFISKEKSGRSFKIRVSPKFYDYFDIEGDKKLRGLFKDVKKPEKVGTLEVYDSSNEEKDHGFSEQILERMKKVDEKPSDREEKKKFLDDFDKKFDSTKNQIDETDNEMNEFRRVKQEEDSGQPEVVDDVGKILKKFNEAIQSLESTNEEETEKEQKEELEEESGEDPKEEKTEQTDQEIEYKEIARKEPEDIASVPLITDVLKVKKKKPEKKETDKKLENKAVQKVVKVKEKSEKEKTTKVKTETKEKKSKEQTAKSKKTEKKQVHKNKDSKKK